MSNKPGRPKVLTEEQERALADDFFNLPKATYTYCANKYGVSLRHAKRLIQQYANGREKEYPKGRNWKYNQELYARRKAKNQQNVDS